MLVWVDLPAAMVPEGSASLSDGVTETTTIVVPWVEVLRPTAAVGKVVPVEEDEEDEVVLMAEDEEDEEELVDDEDDEAEDEDDELELKLELDELDEEVVSEVGLMGEEVEVEELELVGPLGLGRMQCTD